MSYYSASYFHFDNIRYIEQLQRVHCIVEHLRRPRPSLMTGAMIYWLLEPSPPTPTSSIYCISSVQFSHSVVSDSLWPHGLQHTRLPCPSPTPRAYSNSCPSRWWWQPTISSSIVPFFSCLSLSQHQGLFQWVGSSHQVAKGLELQHQSFQWIFKTDFLYNWLVGTPCSPRNSQASSPTPQFKSINSSVLRLHYGPTLTSIHDYWKNHSFD